MDSNQSLDDAGESSAGWGAMGGTSGDGILTSTGGSSSPPPGSPSYIMDRGITTSSTPPQQQSYMSPPGSGSITRFATPDVQQQQQQPQSYAARSQQVYANPQPQQQQPIGYTTTTTPQSPQQQQQPYAGSAMGGGSPSSSSSSYAARSQQAYGTQQQPPQSQQANVYSGGQQQSTTSAQSSVAPPSATTSSYAARSQQTYGIQQQQQPSNVYGGPVQQQQPNVYYGGQQQPAYPRQQPPYGGTGQQQQTSTAGSYAARSAATLYGQQQQQPQAQQQTIQQQQQQQQPGVYPTHQQYQQQQQYGMPQQQQPASGAPPAVGLESAQHQKRLLEDATRKVQEHAYYMKQAMEQHNLPAVLDRAAHMVGELGGPPHGQHHGHTTTNTGCSPKLQPKNYYELYMRALEDMPAFEEYLLELAKHKEPEQPPLDTIRIVEHASAVMAGGSNTPNYTMRQLYDCVQYCPRVVSRLYLQIAAGSALIRSGECGAKWVMQDLQDAVKCEQNPVRGLFLRNFLLTALRDKLPDTVVPSPPAAAEAKDDNDDDSAEDYTKSRNKNIDEQEKGTVKDSYEFVLANFMEMNKLWVRIQHLPGEGRNKDVRKRRERERNDLRILVGTNLVRLSQLENVTSKIYGEIILSQILDHIVTTGDPLSQAYLMDCLVQVFPDEYHIETLPILLNVCPRLRDKVNIRTILQGLMDRLANYLADEELLDETDTNKVKKALARDSFGLFKECVQKVYNARGPKLTSKEVIRLQTALLQFSIKCYPGNMEQVSDCIGVCVSALRQANASYDALPDGIIASNVPPTIKALDDASVVELEKLLSIPLDSLALKVLELEHYSELIGFLPWANRREVGVTLLKAVDNAGSTPKSVKEIEQLFAVIEPLVRDESNTNGTSYVQAAMSADSVARASNLMAGLGVSGMTGQQQPPVQAITFNEPVQAYHDPAQLKKIQQENALVSKLVHLLDHENTDTVYEMLNVARHHISRGSRERVGQTLVAVVFASLRLARRVLDAEQGFVAEAGSSGNEASGEANTGMEENKSKDTLAVPAPSRDDETSSTEAGGESKETPSTVVPEGVPGVGESKGADDVKNEKKPIEGSESPDAVGKSATQSISCRAIFVFIQETIAILAKCNPEKGVKLYLDVSLTADSFSALAKDGADTTDYIPIAYEFLSQAFGLYDESISEGKAQYRCITSMSGTLLASRSLSKEDYETLITKTAQFSARVLKKPDQCQLVALCAHLFYPIGSGEEMKYSNPQRALECLQRSLKLADACTSANPANVSLFVDLLEHYVYFFENKNPLITHAYITGLIALIKEHLSNISSPGNVGEVRAQFLEVVRYIKQKKAGETTADLFAPISLPE